MKKFKSLCRGAPPDRADACQLLLGDGRQVETGSTITSATVRQLAELIRRMVVPIVSRPETVRVDISFRNSSVVLRLYVDRQDRLILLEKDRHLEQCVAVILILASHREPQPVLLELVET